VLWTDDSFPIVNGIADGSLDERDMKWENIFLDRKLLAILLGDPDSGPCVIIAEIPPQALSTASSPLGRLKQWGRAVLPDPFDQLLRRILSLRGSHYHRSDTFRMVLGDNPKHSFTFGRGWHYAGGYRLQRSNHRYREWHSIHGNLEIIVDADRRGHSPIERDLRDFDDIESIRGSLQGAGTYVSQLRTFHTKDAEAVSGLGSTAVGYFPWSGLSGSFLDEDWARLSDGSKVAGLVMGDQVRGPLILLSRNAPNVVESPAGSHSTEILRIVLTGSCAIGDRSYGPGSWRLTDVDVNQEAVVHGPEGSTQLVLFGDRRGWLVDTGVAREAFPRTCELARILETLLIRST
jgi:hypothetical protein